MDTAVEKRFADGTYRFWLPLPRVIEIERKCGTRQADGTVLPKSVFTIYDQLTAGMIPTDDGLAYIGGGSALIGDAREVVRQGLIGGSEGQVDGNDVEVGPIRAGELLDAYTYPARPMIEVVQLAWHILHAAIVGIDVKKKAESAEQADLSLSEKEVS